MNNQVLPAQIVLDPEQPLKSLLKALGVSEHGFAEMLNAAGRRTGVTEQTPEGQPIKRHTVQAWLRTGGRPSAGLLETLEALGYRLVLTAVRVEDQKSTSSQK